MRPRLVDYLNQLFGTSVFGWIVPTPSVIYPLALLVCAVVFVRRCRVSGLDTRTAVTASLVGSVGAFIGAKLFFVANNLEGYILLPSHLFAPGGTMSWGAYTGAILGLVLYLHHKREWSLRCLDVLGSCLGVGTVYWKVELPAERRRFRNDHQCPLGNTISCQKHAIRRACK